MEDNHFFAECADPEKQSITIELPCELAARIQKLADDTNTSPPNILIEAVDTFLRNTP